MAKALSDIAQELKASDKKVQLIYAFNGTGKTRLSKEFARLFQAEEGGLTRDKILYYNAFTEDLFYWDNDLDSNRDFKLKILLYLGLFKSRDRIRILFRIFSIIQMIK